MHTCGPMSRITALRNALSPEAEPISQAALAARLRVNQSTVSRLESGEMVLTGPILTAVEALEREAESVGSEQDAAA